MKDLMVPIDQAGRIVLPKDVRQDLDIKPGDVFKVSVSGTSVTLTPDRQTVGFIRKGNALVFSTTGDDALGSDAVNDLLQAESDEHLARVAGASSRSKRRP